jgi:hypothetical protein
MHISSSITSASLCVALLFPSPGKTLGAFWKHISFTYPQQNMKNSRHPLATLLLPLVSVAHAWLATEYQNLIISVDTYYHDTIARTATKVVVPTNNASPLSTVTSTAQLEELTIVEYVLSDTNLPLASTPALSNVRPAGLPSVSTSGFTSTVYLAPATITQPPKCSWTKFSYCKSVPLSFYPLPPCSCRLTGHQQPTCQLTPQQSCSKRLTQSL